MGASLLLLAVALFVVVGRCNQLRDHSTEATEAAVAELRQALAAGASLEPARSAFEEAARASVADPYPLFCLTVLDDLEGDRQSAGLVALRRGELEAAEAAFAEEAAQATDPRRLEMYLRLVRDLRR